MGVPIFVLAAICLVAAVAAPIVHLPVLVAVVLTLFGSVLLGYGVARPAD